MRKSIWLFVAVFLIHNPAISQSDDPFPACLKRAKESQELDPIRGKLLPEGGEPSFEMLADASRPTSDERAALVVWAKARQECVASAAKWRESLHHDERAVFERADADLIALMADLYNGRLSYGDYHRKQKELLIEANRQLAQIFDRTKNRGATTESPPAPTDPYVAGLAARCSDMGAPASYDERAMDRHITCVKGLHAQEQQQSAREAEAWGRAFQRRGTTTNCRADGLGGVTCNTR